MSLGSEQVGWACSGYDFGQGSHAVPCTDVGGCHCNITSPVTRGWSRVPGSLASVLHFFLAP